MTDAKAAYRDALNTWSTRVRAVTPDQLDRPTPCTAWTVRDLLNHVVVEQLWAEPLMQGQTIEQVGSRFDGDMLGADPLATARSATEDATDLADLALGGRKVHLSYGDEDAEEYLWQLTLDHTIHAWDLAVATGGARVLDPALVAVTAEWFAGRMDMYRAGGAIGPIGPSGDDPQSRLLSSLGRDAAWGPNHAMLATFSAAFGRGDVDQIMALMTEDCVFESTTPAPDGTRFTGADAVRGVWIDVFGGTPGAAFTEEESFVHADRGVLRWRFSWTEPDGTAGHVRGVDVLRFRDGRVCEKLSYVKG